jgi:uncharacterized protein YdeI (YjbR/CyaY-like superfamily)
MKADRFFEKDQKWQLEMETLREIVLECDLEEESNGCILVIRIKTTISS